MRKKEGRVEGRGGESGGEWNELKGEVMVQLARGDQTAGSKSSMEGKEKEEWEGRKMRKGG